MKTIKVGIVGCGVIGGVMKKWIESHNPKCEIYVLDPPKGLHDDLSSCDIVFVSIHIPTEANHTQNLSSLNSIIEQLPDVPIFIRTTLLPGTCDNLAKKFNKRIYFLPEFLTERTAYEDFCAQPMIYTGYEDLMKEIFVGKKYITMNNLEAEIVKYAHNVFGALKVTYFNGIYELAHQYNCNYEKIRNGVLLSGYINPNHTMVPGPDGKLGYGGKCFPKDVAAFSKYCENTKIGKLIELAETINTFYRGN